MPNQYTRRTKPLRVPFQYGAELASRARGAVIARQNCRACLVDFPHRVRGREEERDGADDSLHVGRPARKLVERRRARAPSARARRALGVCSVCTTVTSRRGARPVTGIPVAATSQSRSLSPARVGRAGGALLGRRVRRAASPRDVLCLPNHSDTFAPARRRAPSTLAPAVLEGMQSITHAWG